MRKTLVPIFALAAMCLQLAGCSNNDAQIPDNEIRCHASPEVHSLMLGLAGQFLGPRQEMTFRLADPYIDPLVGIDTGAVNLLVIRDDTALFSDKGFEFYELGSHALVTIFNYEHPGIATLAQSGADPAALNAAFSGQINDWKDLNPGLSPNPLRTYVFSDQTNVESAGKYLAFLKVEKPAGIESPGTSDLISKVLRDTFALGYSFSSTVYDHATGFRRNGLYILPLDLDSSGFIEDKEHIYDDLRMFNKALRQGAYPAGLVTRYYLAVPAGKKNKALGEFIRWMEGEGTQACGKLGFSRS